MSGACAVSSVPLPPVKVSETSHVGGTGATVTATVALTPFGAVAVSVVEPVATPVTIAVAAPVLATVAMLAFPEVHANVTPLIGRPFWSMACALTDCVPNAFTDTGVGVSTTDVTVGGARTFTVIVADTPLGAVAVIVVVPGATPFTVSTPTPA